MDSPAQRQAEANAEVERIAQAIYEEVWKSGGWERLADEHREVWCGWVRNLLRAGVFRPPQGTKTEPPMTGQTDIDEFLEAP